MQKRLQVPDGFELARVPEADAWLLDGDAIWWDRYAALSTADLYALERFLTQSLQERESAILQAAEEDEDAADLELDDSLAPYQDELDRISALRGLLRWRADFPGSETPRWAPELTRKPATDFRGYKIAHERTIKIGRELARLKKEDLPEYEAVRVKKTTFYDCAKRVIGCKSRDTVTSALKLTKCYRGSQQGSTDGLGEMIEAVEAYASQHSPRR